VAVKPEHRTGLASGPASATEAPRLTAIVKNNLKAERMIHLSFCAMR
jgi:hypothetical protein